MAEIIYPFCKCCCQCISDCTDCPTTYTATVNIHSCYDGTIPERCCEYPNDCECRPTDALDINGTYTLTKVVTPPYPPDPSVCVWVGVYPWGFPPQSENCGGCGATKIIRLGCVTGTNGQNFYRVSLDADDSMICLGADFAMSGDAGVCKEGELWCPPTGVYTFTGNYDVCGGCVVSGTITIS